MWGKRFIVPVVLALVAALVTGSARSGDEQGGALGPNQIGFYRNPIPGRWALWAVNTDGSHEHRVISRLNGAWEHTSSPDYRLVAYVKRKAIYVMRPDGRGKRRAIGPGIPGDADAGLTEPAWSPDGSALAFVAACGKTLSETTWGIYVASVKGGTPRALVPCDRSGGGTELGGRLPDWSTTNWIAYRRSFITWPSDIETGIWAIRPDGSQNHLILDTDTYGPISWSPDGKQLAYQGFGNNIGIINADGTNNRLLIDGCGNPDWAPTGEILCRSIIKGLSGAATIRPDGTGFRLLHPRRPRTGERGYFWMRARSS
jgi:Tol biopolymer transport system component